MNIKYLIRFFKEISAPWRNMIFLMFLISLVVGVLNAGYPFLIKLITDVLSTHARGAQITWPFIVIISLWIVIESLNKIHEILMILVFPRLRVYCRLAVIRYLFKKDFVYYSKKLTGTISTRLSYVISSVEKIIEQVVFQYAGLFIMLLTSLFLLLSVSFKFVIYVTTWLVYHILITVYFLKTGKHFSKKEYSLYASFQGAIIDAFRGIHTLISLHAIRTEEQYIIKNQEQVTLSEYRTKWHFEKMKVCQSLGALFLMSMNLRQLYLVWTYNDIPIGDVPMVLMLTGTILGHFWMIVESFAKLVERLYRFQDALDYIFSGELPTLNKVVKNAKKKQAIEEFLSVRHVSYAYENESYIIKDTNIEIKSNEKILLYGRNGIGKSTLLLLMAGFLKPNQGSVKLSSQALLINTHLSLFNRSIYENILLANPLASLDEVKKALTLACCDEFILALPDGVDSVLDEDGKNFSSGQRQRLCVARAFVTDKRIILLDEIFSNIDEKSRKVIFNNLLLHLEHKILIFSEKDSYPEQKACRQISLEKLLQSD